MDDYFSLVTISAGIIIGLIVLLVWMKSRGRRGVVKAITQAQEALKLTPYVGTHPQLDAVWYAVRGQVSRVTIRIFGGMSRGGRNAGVTAGTVAKATAIDRTCVMIVVSLPNIIPFRMNLQRRSALSTPRFGTSYEEFDKVVEVTTENEKQALTLLNNEQLRNAIVSFMKLTGYAYITNSEVMIKVSSDKQILPIAHEAISIANLLGNQIEKIH
jgi:hypothetical protein